MFNKLSLLIIVFAASAILSIVVLTRPKYEPLESTSTIVLSQIAGVSPAQVYDRQPIEVHMHTCAKEDVTETFDVIFLKVDDSEGINAIPSLAGIGLDKSKGCHDTTIRLGLPTAITEGTTWVVQLKEHPEKGEQSLVSKSTPFTIIK